MDPEHPRAKPQPLSRRDRAQVPDGDLVGDSSLEELAVVALAGRGWLDPGPDCGYCGPAVGAAPSGIYVAAAGLDGDLVAELSWVHSE